MNETRGGLQGKYLATKLLKLVLSGYFVASGPKITLVNE